MTTTTKTTTKTTTTTTDERLERALRGLFEALTRAKRTRALRETLDDDAEDLRHTIDHTIELEADDLRSRLRAVIHMVLTRDVSETAVALLAHKYLDGTFMEPAAADQVAFDYATVLMGADDRDKYMNEDAADKFEAIVDDYFAALYADGFEDNEMFAADEMLAEALEDLRGLFREPDDSSEVVAEIAKLCQDAWHAHYKRCDGSDERYYRKAADLIRAIIREARPGEDVDEKALDMTTRMLAHRSVVYPLDKRGILDAYACRCEPVKIEGFELIDDTDENLDDLLRVGHMTVDDLLRRLPDGKGDKISLASALVTGGLVCDPNGRVYLEAFAPTEATSNYPRFVADLLVDNRMDILTKAFDIIDFAADTRTVQLSRDMYATILGFSEISEDIWVPYVQDWESDPHAAKWARHEKRWQAVVGAYEELYDAYNAGRPTFEATDDDEAPAEPHLDEYLVATGGWLRVEDEVTGDQWLVNALDVYGFDDARTLADAGDLWNSSHYRVRRHEASKNAA